MIRRIAVIVLALTILIGCGGHGSPALITSDLHANVVNQVAQWLAVSPSTGLIYFTQLDSGLVTGNLMSLDPTSSVVTQVAALPYAPRQVVISDDGLTAYVVEGTGSRFTKIDLLNAGSPTTYSVGSPKIGDLTVMPRQSGTVALSTFDSGGVFQVFLYTDGVREPNTITGPLLGGLAFSGPGLLYATDVSSSDNKLVRIKVDASGVTIIDSRHLFFEPGGITSAFGDGKLFYSTGEVVDPLSARILASTPGQVWNEIGVAPARNRGYALNSAILFSLDLQSLKLVGNQTVDAIGGLQTPLVPYGAHGLAFLTTDAKIGLIDNVP